MLAVNEVPQFVGNAVQKVVARLAMTRTEPALWTGLAGRRGQVVSAGQIDEVMQTQPPCRRCF